MLSRREKIVALVTLIILGLLVADRTILTPVLRQLDAWQARRQELTAELAEAQLLLDRRGLMERRWRAMAGAGLAAGAESESRVLHALNRWCQEAGLTLTSVKPVRASVIKDDLHEMTFAVAGTGTLHAVATFMWSVERAELPLRLRDLQLGSADAGGTQMSVQFDVSALMLAAAASPSGGSADAS